MRRLLCAQWARGACGTAVAAILPCETRAIAKGASCAAGCHNGTFSAIAAFPALAARRFRGFRLESSSNAREALRHTRLVSKPAACASLGSAGAAGTPFCHLTRRAILLTLPSDGIGQHEGSRIASNWYFGAATFWAIEPCTARHAAGRSLCRLIGALVAAFADFASTFGADGPRKARCRLSRSRGARSARWAKIAILL